MKKTYIPLFLMLFVIGKTSADVTGTWTDAASGNWYVGTNWSSNPDVPGVPYPVSGFDSATFGTLPAGNYTITLQDGSGNGTSVNLHALAFDSVANQYTISEKTGATQIVMKGRPAPFVGSSISVLQGSHTIDAPLVLNFQTSINMGQTSASTLTFSANGAVSHSGVYGFNVSSTNVSQINNFSAMSPYSIIMSDTNFNNDNPTHSGANHEGVTVTTNAQFDYHATGSNTATFNNYYFVDAGSVQLGTYDGHAIIYNNYYYVDPDTRVPYAAQISSSGSIDIGDGSGITDFYNYSDSNLIYTTGDDSYFTIGSGSGTTNITNTGSSSQLYTAGIGSYLVIGNGSGTTNVTNEGNNSSIYTTGVMSLMQIGSGSGPTNITNFGSSSQIYTSADRADIIAGSGSSTTTIVNSGDYSTIYTAGTYSDISLGTGVGTTHITNSGSNSGVYTDNIFSDITIGSSSGTTTFENSGDEAYIQTNDLTSSIIIGSGSGETTVSNSGSNGSIYSANDLSIGGAYGTTVMNNNGCFAELYANRTMYLGANGNGFTTVNNRNDSVDSCGGDLVDFLDTILSQGDICVGGVNTIVNNVGQVNMDAYGSLIVDDGLINNTMGASLLTEHGIEVRMHGGQIFNDGSSFFGSSSVDYNNYSGFIQDNANTNQSGSFEAGTYRQFVDASLEFGIYSPNQYGALHASQQANLNGTLIVQTLPGHFFKGDDYLTLVQADGGRVGTFSEVLFNNFPKHLIGNISYGADTVNLSFANVLGPLNSFPSGGVSNTVFVAVNQNNIQLLTKMNQLRDRMAPISSRKSGGEVAFCDEVSFSVGPRFGTTKSNVEQKQRTLVDKAVVPEVEKRYPARIYAGPTFSFGNVENEGRQIGFDYNSNGLFAGFDYALDRFGFGTAVNYSSLGADVQRHWGSFDVNQAGASFYTVYSPASCEQLSINGIIGGSYDWYDFTRVAGPSFATETAKGETDGYVLDALFGLEYTLNRDVSCRMPKDCRFIPLFNIQYIYLHKNQYTEENAGVYDLNVKHESLNSLRTALGTRMDRLWAWKNWSFRPQLNIAWQYEYLTQNRTVIFSGVNSIADAGVGFVPIVASRSTLLAGVDLLFTICDVFEIESTYELEYNKFFFDNSFYVGIGGNF